MCLHYDPDILGQILGVIASPRSKLQAQTQDELLKNCIFLIKTLKNVNLHNSFL